MAMNDAPAISLASEDPRRADLKYRLLCTMWDHEAHFLTLYNIAEIPVYVRRNPLDRKPPIAVLRIRPLESCRDLIPTMLATPDADAKGRDLGRASPEIPEGLRAP